MSDNHTDHYVRDPEPAPVIVPEPEYPPAPAPEPETAPAQNVYYPNCKAAKAAGAAPLYQGEQVTDLDWIVTKTASPANDKFY